MMVSPEQIIITGVAPTLYPSSEKPCLHRVTGCGWKNLDIPARKILGTNGLDIVAVPVDSGDSMFRSGEIKPLMRVVRSSHRRDITRQA